jgi:hypothetical protein
VIGGDQDAIGRRERLLVERDRVEIEGSVVAQAFRA